MHGRRSAETRGVINPERYNGSKVVVINRSRNTFVDDNCTLGERHGLTNAQYFGPGIWHMMHGAALEADMKPSDVTNFIWFLNLALNILPCPDCRNHFARYVKDNPLPVRPHNNVIGDPETAVNQGVYFKWTVDFHNAVTVRTSQEQDISPPKCQFTVSYAFSEFVANKNGFGCEKCKSKGE